MCIFQVIGEKQLEDLKPIYRFADGNQDLPVFVQFYYKNLLKIAEKYSKKPSFFRLDLVESNNRWVYMTSTITILGELLEIENIEERCMLFA